MNKKKKNKNNKNENENNQNKNKNNKNKNKTNKNKKMNKNNKNKRKNKNKRMNLCNEKIINSSQFFSKLSSWFETQDAMSLLAQFEFIIMERLLIICLWFALIIL